MNRNSGMNAGQVIGNLDGQQVVGLDIAKHVFQLHTVAFNTWGRSKSQQMADLPCNRWGVLRLSFTISHCSTAITRAARKRISSTSTDVVRTSEKTSSPISQDLGAKSSVGW